VARTKAPTTGKSTKTAPQKRTAAAKSPAKKQRSKATPEIDQRYRSLFDNSLDAILVADDEQNYIDANPAACKLLGYKKNELLKKQIKDIVHLPVELKEELWDDFVEKRTQVNLICLKRKDGEILEAEYAAVANFMPGMHMSIIRDVTERKQTENKLRKSEQRLDTILQTLMDGVVMVTTEGNIIFANQAAETILGIKKDEIKGKYYNSREWKQFDEFDNPYPMDQLPLTIAMRERRPVEAIEHAIVSPEGEKKWLTVNAAPLFDEEGNLYGAIAGFQDSTRRRRVEQQLVLNTRAIESVSEGVIITAMNQPDEPIIYSNQGFYNITGYTPEEVLGRNCRFLQGANTDPNTLKVIATAINEQNSFEGEILNYKKDGTPFWNFLRIYPITNQNGKMTHMVGFQSDITDRKHMEEMLRQSEQRFMTTFHSSPVSAALISMQTGKVLDLNEACAEMLGYQHAELFGKNVKNFDIAFTPHRFDELFEEIQSGVPIKNSERRFRRKSGELGTGLLSAELIEVDSQPCALFIMTDITERKKTEIQLSEQLNELMRWNNVTIGREMRVLELKSEVNRLLGELGNPPRYSSTDTES
jgi:PAS domain S-box-containing protein